MCLTCQEQPGWLQQGGGWGADMLLSPHLVPASLHRSLTLCSPTEFGCRAPEAEAFLKTKLETPTSKCKESATFRVNAYSLLPLCLASSLLSEMQASQLPSGPDGGDSHWCPLGKRAGSGSA